MALHVSEPGRFAKISALVLLPVLLSGCVAALIPVAASGVLARKNIDVGGADAREPVEEVAETMVPENTEEPLPALPPVAPHSEPSETVPTEIELSETSGAEASPAVPTPVELAPALSTVVLADVDPLTFNLAAVRAPAKEVSGTVQTELTPSVAIANQPAKDSGQPTDVQPEISEFTKPQADPGLQRPISSHQAFSGIFRYVVTQAGRDPIFQPRQSAILAAPGSLSPDRADCSVRPPAVVIDLDPADGVFDPAIAAKGDSALLQMLRAFRMQDTSIFWISGRSAIDAGAVRKRLIESGLDPVGRDRLLLMRRADDRKQTRRRDLSETHCVVAIAGDSRSDFDELYDYLKDPSAAKPLDEMLDAGWFMTPLPLLDISTTEGQ